VGKAVVEEAITIDGALVVLDVVVGQIHQVEMELRLQDPDTIGNRLPDTTVPLLVHQDTIDKNRPPAMTDLLVVLDTIGNLTPDTTVLRAVAPDTIEDHRGR